MPVAQTPKLVIRKNWVDAKSGTPINRLIDRLDKKNFPIKMFRRKLVYTKIVVEWISAVGGYRFVKSNGLTEKGLK